MKLTILGSGTYQPELERHCSSYLVQVNRQNLVFDFGRGTLDQLLKLGVSYYNIDTIFITHCHGDHISELSSFLHIALTVDSKRKRGITIYGPVGIKRSINNLLRATGLFGRKHPIYKIKIKEIKNSELVRGKGWLVRGYTVSHVSKMRCLAYRIQADQKVLAYSGDTGNCQGLYKACRDADLAIIEANSPKSVKDMAGHLTSGEAGQIASDSSVKKLVLTHISAERLKKEDPKSEAKEFFRGSVVLAKDSMKIKI